MKNNILILIAILIVVGYMFQPVPYCQLIPDSELVDIEPDAIYSEPEVVELTTALEKGFIIVQTLGESMFPTIKTNSMCLCQVEEHYQVEDIVLFYVGTDSNYQGIAHRIVAENETHFQTKGDANLHLDAPFLKEGVLCRIPYIERYKIK